MANDPTRPRERFTRRLAALEEHRTRWESGWRDVSRYALPGRGRFDTSKEGGKRDDEDIINNTALWCLRTVLPSGLQSGLTSPSRPWFKLATSDPDMMEVGTVREWLEAVERRIQAIYAAGNLYTELGGLYEELGGFGTACIAQLEDYENVVRFRSFTAGEYWLACDERGMVDTFYRSYRATVAQLVRRFGEGKVSRSVKEAHDRGDHDRWIECVHCIERNDDPLDGLSGPGRKPWRSVYFEVGGDQEKLLGVSGFDEFPIHAPRWSVVGSDVYGRGPGMDAIGDIKQLQYLEMAKAELIGQVVEPSLQAPAALRGRGLSRRPGGITYVDQVGPQNAIQPLFQVSPQALPSLLEDKREIEQRITRMLYADLFLMLATMDPKRMTAREVAERHEEKLLMLGPVLERLNDDLLDPLIERTFAVALRAGALPPPPRELQGATIKLEYVSTLQQAQQLVGMQSVERLLQLTGAAAQFWGDVTDKVDADQVIDEYAQRSGVPARIVRSDEDVAALRRQRQEAMAAQQQAAMLQGAAESAAKLGGVKTGEPNLLTDLAGAMGG